MNRGRRCKYLRKQILKQCTIIDEHKLKHKFIFAPTAKYMVIIANDNCTMYTTGKSRYDCYKEILYKLSLNFTRC